MLIKQIECEMVKGMEEQFSQAQEQWSRLKRIKGLAAYPIVRRRNLMNSYTCKQENFSGNHRTSPSAVHGKGILSVKVGKICNKRGEICAEL